MSRRVALLRGVNVGGRNRLPMATFAQLLEGLGCRNVETLIQSGNAVFDGAASPADIAAAIRREAGFSCRVFVLTATAFQRAVAACPFRRQAEESGKSVHGVFLEAAPDAATVEALGAALRAREDFAVAGKTLYFHSPPGPKPSIFLEAMDRALGGATTARNWNTIERLAAMAAGKERPAVRGRKMMSGR